MIRIFSRTDMIKIWNWFKAIGVFVRKIKEKNTSADLSNSVADLYWYQSVLVPICPVAEVSCIHQNLG